MLFFSNKYIKIRTKSNGFLSSNIEPIKYYSNYFKVKHYDQQSIQCHKLKNVQLTLQQLKTLDSFVDMLYHINFTPLMTDLIA